MSFDVIDEAEQGRARISVTAQNGSLLTVTRRHPSGRVLPVRGMDKASLSGGAFLGWDYEMPVGVEVTYVATTWADPSTPLDTSDAVTLTWTSTNDWLKDPLEPIRNMPIRVIAKPENTYDTPTAVHTILGRPDPVTVGEIRRAATGDLQVLTFTAEERERFHLLTSSGHPLLFQSTQESGVGNMYLAAIGLKETPVSPIRDETMVAWTLSYQEVGMPVGDASAFTTWQDVLNQYPLWSDVVAQNDTWIDLIANLNQTREPPVLVWRGS